MFWVRVDNRLVHGQVIEAWLPFTDADLLVVCNNAVAADVLQQEIMTLAIPNSVETLFLPVAGVHAAMTAKRPGYPQSDTMLLFNNCQDARHAVAEGLQCKTMNIGNVHYAPGKRQLLPHVAVSDEEAQCLGWFAQQGLELDFRCLPSEPVTIKPVW